MKIIAVDFDGTLCKDAYPGIGEPNTLVIEELKQRKENGDKVILWTCRCGKQLQEAVAWCRKMGLEFDEINDNLAEHIEQYGSNCRKVFADEYWDDKAMPPCGYTWIATGESCANQPRNPGEIYYIPSNYVPLWDKWEAWWRKWVCE